MTTALNLGSNVFRLSGFVNIDADPGVSPDLCIDLRQLTQHFNANSVDFINAGHIFEHLEWSEGLSLARDCLTVLKPFASLLVVVPDYKKATDLEVGLAEQIILAGGQHKALYSEGRLVDLVKSAGFRFWSVPPLEAIPWLIVSDMRNPKPEPWQSAILATKTP